MRNGDGRTGGWLEKSVISKNEGLFFFSKIDYVCVFTPMEMIRREKQFHDVGDRGDNWKSNVLRRQGSPDSRRWSKTSVGAMAAHHLKSSASRYSMVLGKEVLYREAKFSTNCFYSPKKGEAGSLSESL